MFSEHARNFILTGTELMTMVCDERWKLVEFVDSDQGQLFDLANDPDELVNVWENPAGAQAEVKAALLHMLSRWRAKSALRTANLWRVAR